jgi:hypothetical protein
MALPRMTVAVLMSALALSACSSSGEPEPGPPPVSSSSSASADPLGDTPPLLQALREQSGRMSLACGPSTPPDDRDCGEAVERMGVVAHTIRGYLAKIPPNAEVTKLDGALADIEKGVGALRGLACYGLAKPPRRDADRATKQQLCFVDYGIVLAGVTRATDPMTTR